MIRKAVAPRDIIARQSTLVHGKVRIGEKRIQHDSGPIDGAFLTFGGGPKYTRIETYVAIGRSFLPIGDGATQYGDIGHSLMRRVTATECEKTGNKPPPRVHEDRLIVRGAR
jgi:hypothetical protein